MIVCAALIVDDEVRLRLHDDARVGYAQKGAVEPWADLGASSRPDPVHLVGEPNLFIEGECCTFISADAFLFARDSLVNQTCMVSSPPLHQLKLKGRRRDGVSARLAFSPPQK